MPQLIVFPVFFVFIPQTVLNCRGSDGLVKGPVLIPGIRRSSVEQLLCAGCGDREGSQLKWSVARLSTEKHDGFASFCFQDASHASGAPGSYQGAQESPGEPRKVSQSASMELYDDHI